MQTTDRFVKELLSYKEDKSRCVNVFYKTVPYSQTSIFLVNILILKYYSSFDQGMIIIHTKSWRIEKHKKGSWIGILKFNGKNTLIFILVHLNSNYSRPPVKVISPLSNEVLIHYIQLNNTICFNNC